MDLQLKDKCALVTGGSRGIGFYTATALAQEGCNLAICARGGDTLQESGEKLRGLGVKVVDIQADVCAEDDCQRVIDTCIGELGALDILINNAGGASGGGLTDSTDDDWRETYELNVFAAVRLIRMATPHMKGRPGASVVNVSSISGWSPPLGGFPQYGSSKASLIFLGESLALQLVKDGIRVNTVSPGSVIWDDSGWDNYRKSDSEAFAAYERDGFPMGRLGKPDEIADVITFLASPRSNWINGRNIAVDGLEQPVPVAKYRFH